MDSDKSILRQELGRKNREQGLTFEARVAELYRLLKYTVDEGRIFHGRQIDLFLTGKWGDLVVNRAVECKSGDVTVKHIDEFLLKLRLVRKDCPDALGAIVTGVSYTDAVSAHAAAEGITLVTFKALTSSLLDGSRYANGLLLELQRNERYDFSKYVEPHIGHEISGPAKPASELLGEWLNDGDARQLTLLGDLGTGKSFLCRMLSHQLAKSYLENPQTNPLPVLVDLRDTDRELSREGLIVTHFARSGLEGISFNIFLHCLREGNIVLLLDGFDEMASRVSENVTVRNFSELMRCVEGRAKVILTCRTHYFRDRTEEEEILLSANPALASDSAKDIYWDLIGRQGYRIAYLRPFTLTQIADYVNRVRPDEHRQIMESIRNTYDLVELSSRPLLLDMIVRTIDRLTTQKINAATLYQVFTNTWITRDSWRNVLTSEEKQSFLLALAKRFWQTTQVRFHYKELLEYVKGEFAARLRDERGLNEIDHEIRTASFLTRDSQGNYGFAHKSYAEFFLAQFIADDVRAGRAECLDDGRLSPEVASFVRELLLEHDATPMLEEILRSSYRRTRSENALLLMYSIRLHLARASSKAGTDIVVELPSGMQLAGAQLGQVNLERSKLRQADLRAADFSQSALIGVDCEDSTFENAILDKADISQSRFIRCKFSHASLSSVNAANANLSRSDFSGASLTYSELSTAIAEDATFERTITTGAVLSHSIGAALGGEKESQRLQSRTAKVAQGPGPWAAIEKLLPRIRKIAQRVSLIDGSDPDENVSDTILHLLNSYRLSELSSVDEGTLLAMIQDSVRRVQQTRSRERNRLVSIDAENWDDEDGHQAPSEAQEIHLAALLAQFSPLGDESIEPSLQIEATELLSSLNSRLAPMNQQVLHALIAGENLEEVSTRLQLTAPQVRRAVSFIRRTLKELYGMRADSTEES